MGKYLLSIHSFSGILSERCVNECLASNLCILPILNPLLLGTKALQTEKRGRESGHFFWKESKRGKTRLGRVKKKTGRARQPQLRWNFAIRNALQYVYYTTTSCCLENIWEHLDFLLSLVCRWILWKELQWELLCLSGCKGHFGYVLKSTSLLFSFLTNTDIIQVVLPSITVVVLEQIGPYPHSTFSLPGNGHNFSDGHVKLAGTIRLRYRNFCQNFERKTHTDLNEECSFACIL